jgi:TolA-binding protein
MECRHVLGVAVLLLGGMLASAQEAKLDPMATRDYAVATGLQSQRLYPEAIVRWQRFLTSYPKDPRCHNARHNLGICQLQSKKFPEAIATFRALLGEETFPSRDAAQFNLGLAQYHLGLQTEKVETLDEAARSFAELVKTDPKSENAASACYYEGECYFAARQLGEAIAAYQKLIKNHDKSPLLPEAYYALGTTQQEAGLHVEAEKTYRVFLTRWSKEERAPECQLRLGQTLFQQKKYNEAEAIFRKVVALPRFALADYALMQQAECLEARGKLPQAAQLFEQLPRRFHKSAYADLALLGAGKCWFRVNNYHNAERTLRQAVQHKKQAAAEAAYWLGRSLVELKRLPDAVNVLDEAIRAYPESPFVPQMTFTRINALYEQPSRRQETVALYETFAKKYPEHQLAPRAKYMAALAAMQVGDLATARRVAEEFLGTADFAKHELTPSVLFLAGETYLNASESDLVKAEPLYRRVFTEYPKHPQAARAQLRAGFCRYSARDANSAIPLLKSAYQALKEPALRAEASFLLGRCHQANKANAQAVAAFEKALADVPKWERGDEVHLALADALRALNRSEDARTHLLHLTTNYPRSPLRDQAFYQLAEIALDKKQQGVARGHYNQVVSNFPRSDLVPLARYGIASTHFAEKNYPQTVAALDPLLAAKPEGELLSKAHYLRGLAHYRLGQFEPGSKDLQAFLASEPPEKQALDAMHTLARCQVGLKQFEPAAATLTDLLKRAPDHPRADQLLYEKAFALLEAKKRDDGVATFVELTTRFPDSPLAGECHFRLGEFHEQARELDRASAAYKLAAQKAKKPALSEKALYKLGWVKHQQKQYAEAAVTLQEQITRHPSGELLLDGTYLAGEALWRAGEPAKAVVLFEKVAQAKPVKYHARALYRIGICRANLEQWPESAKAYAELIEAFPKFELLQEARYGLGLALTRQSKYDEAKTVLEVITRETNTETAAKARFLIGECAFDQKAYREAATHFLEAALGYPYPEWQALSYYEAGRCFKELKDFERARDNFKTLIQQFPTHPRAKDAAGLLENLP